MTMAHLRVLVDHPLERSWQERGECHFIPDEDKAAFWAETPEERIPAIKLCRRCTERTVCLDTALDEQAFGVVRGGVYLSLKQLRRLTAQRRGWMG